MNVKELLIICEDCLCFTCHDRDCRKLACDNCELKEAVTECPGYIGEVKIG